jgi:hypothetical protein
MSEGALRLAAGGERAAYALVALLALAVRVIGLGDRPLSGAEAGGAWMAWRAAVGAGLPAEAFSCAASPLVMGLQWGLFSLGLAGDLAARLPVAVMGSALALLPALLRRGPGDVSALAAAALLAGDPLLVAESRRAEGPMPAVFLAALALACATRARWAGPRWMSGAVVCAGLLLVSGREAWPLLGLVAVLAAVAGVHRVPRPPGLAGALLAAALLGGTALLAEPAFLGGVSASLAAWAVGCAEAAPGAASWTVLARREAVPLALVACAAALGGWRAWRRSSVAVLSAGGFGLLLALSADTARTGAVVVVASLVWLAGVSVAHLQEAAVRVVSRRGRLPAFVTAGAAVLAVSFFGIVAGALRPERPGTSGPVASRLAADLARLGWERAGDPTELAVEVVSPSGPDPAVAWTLRRQRRIRFVTAPGVAASPVPVVVSPADDPHAPGLAQTHLGSRYGGLVLWVPR